MTKMEMEAQVFPFLLIRLGETGVPHSAFPNPLAGEDELPRESIEARFLVTFGDLG